MEEEEEVEEETKDLDRLGGSCDLPEKQDNQRSLILMKTVDGGGGGGGGGGRRGGDDNEIKIGQ